VTLHVIYRASPGIGKNRPPGFSKAECLSTFLRSFESVEGARVTFLVDGEIPEDVLRVMTEFGETMLLPGVGNCGSYLQALDTAISTEAGASHIYFCEDDYFHTVDALRSFVDALSEAPLSTYLTLYDHPDRYRRADDLGIPGPQVCLLAGRHWRSVESSAMTFGSSRETITRDAPFLRLAARFTHYPHDRAMWRTLQGLGVRRPVRWLRGQRKLLSPVPGLATHVEDQMMSEVVPWSEVRQEAVAWVAATGLRIDSGW